MRVAFPGGYITGIDRVDVTIKRDYKRARADTTDQVAHRIDRDFFKPDPQHFLPDPFDDVAFLGTQ